jgi:1-deoxy-D-xylulose-5-phosphate reductoisomerase
MSERADSMRPQRVCVLGATGSVGMATLDVMGRHPERFEVFALTAQSRVDELFALCLRTRPRYAVVGTAAAAARLASLLVEARLRTEVMQGEQALCELAAHPEVDTVMAAIVGAAGLASCLAAAKAGKRLLLANKPIDSEHSAIFQCLPADRSSWSRCIDHIVLTASGGPFRGRYPATLGDVTPAEACAHPNWVMGRKISVDSATMMNKALEVIEAHYLFGLAPEQIRVVIHPQSVIHSMVVCRDHSVLAQLGTPDMRVPIAYGLAWPERIASGTAPVDWRQLAALTFEDADPALYPGLGLAWEALRGPPGTSAVLNAANEEAVAAFLAGTIRFDRIHSVNARTLAALVPPRDAADSLPGLLALDAEARRRAGQFLQNLAA